MSDQKNHIEHLEASLNAARREADALREQVQLHERRRNSSAPMTAAPLAVATMATTSHDFNMDSAWATLLAQVSNFFWLQKEIKIWSLTLHIYSSA